MHERERAAPGVRGAARSLCVRDLPPRRFADGPRGARPGWAGEGRAWEL